MPSFDVQCLQVATFLQQIVLSKRSGIGIEDLGEEGEVLKEYLDRLEQTEYQGEREAFFLFLDLFFFLRGSIFQTGSYFPDEGVERGCKFRVLKA